MLTLPHAVVLYQTEGVERLHPNRRMSIVIDELMVLWLEKGSLVVSAFPKGVGFFRRRAFRIRSINYVYRL
jgi:hypothetical protein